MQDQPSISHCADSFPGRSLQSGRGKNRLKLIKIDTEGAERTVLEGAKVILNILFSRSEWLSAYWSVEAVDPSKVG